MIYLTPTIEIEKIEAEDVILASPGTQGGGLGGGNETGWVSDEGTISGTSSGKITIGGNLNGGFTSGDLFGNR